MTWGMKLPPPTAEEGWATDTLPEAPPPVSPIPQGTGLSAFDYQQRREAAIPEGYTGVTYLNSKNATDPSAPVWAPGESYHGMYAQYNSSGTRIIGWADTPQVMPMPEPEGFVDPYAPPPTAEEGWYNLPEWAVDQGRTQTHSPLLPGFDFDVLPTPGDQVEPLPDYLGDDQRYVPGPQEGVVSQTGTEGALPVYGSINDLPGEYMQGSNGTYLVINQPGELRLANGAAVYFTGAGTEIIGSDGLPYEWSDMYQRYLPMKQGVNSALWGDAGQSSFITDISQFHRLPQEIQQAIRNGEQTPFQLAPEVIAMVRQGMGYGSTGDQLSDPNVAPSGVRGYLEQGFPTEMTDYYTDPASGIGTTDIYGYNRGLGFNTPEGQVFETGLYSMPEMVSDPWAPEDAEYVRSVWEEAAAAMNEGITPEEFWATKEAEAQAEYEAQVEELFGTRYGDLLEPTSYDGLPTYDGSEFDAYGPQDQYWSPEDQVNYERMQEIRETGQWTDPETGITHTREGPTDLTGTLSDYQGVWENGEAQLKSLPSEQQASQEAINAVTEPTATADDDFSVLTYGGETYQNLPSLLFAQGFISEAEYNTLTDAPTEIPGLDVILPSPSSLNFTRLEMIRTTDPSSWGMLQSLWKAANRDLATEYYVARLRAPLGSAVQPTLIRT